MGAWQGALARIGVLAAAVGLSAPAHAWRMQPPEALELGSARCSTEGGEIEVIRDGGRITYWKGSFCRSTDCTTFEVEDIQEDGLAIVTVAGDYFDGGNISYSAKVRMDQPAWQPETMMSVYYGDAMREDIRQIQSLFEATEGALAHHEPDVRCR